MKYSYGARAEFCKNSLAQKLLRLMDTKKTNLAFSADVLHGAELLKLADLLGPEICIFKTHVDILDDFTPQIVQELKALAEKHQFLIFEDRKFADIGSTVKKQYEGGIYRIADWADLINAHSMPGPSVIEGLMKSTHSQERGLLLVAEMSTENNLMDAVYAQETLELAEQYPEFVIGFITQRQLSEDPQWIYFTPGVKLNDGEDSLGQQYNTPESAILYHHSDIIIVGRGILRSPNPLEEAKKYREAGWEAYLRR